MVMHQLDISSAFFMENKLKMFLYDNQEGLRIHIIQPMFVNYIMLFMVGNSLWELGFII